MDFAACLTAALVFVCDVAAHRSGTVTVHPGRCAGLPRLPNERLYLLPQSAPDHPHGLSHAIRRDLTAPRPVMATCEGGPGVEFPATPGPPRHPANPKDREHVREVPHRQPSSRSRRHRWIAASVLGALAALAVIAVLTAPNATAEPDGFTCEEITSANLVTGSGPGDTSSGQAAILGFHHAFYVDRSAAHAQRLLTPDSVLAVDNRLQIGIDAVPTDTRHCVNISPLTAIGDAQRWAVTATEFRPGIEPWVTRQTVTTRTVDGVALISEIAPA